MGGCVCGCVCLGGGGRTHSDCLRRSALPHFLCTISRPLTLSTSRSFQFLGAVSVQVQVQPDPSRHLSLFCVCVCVGGDTQGLLAYYFPPLDSLDVSQLPLFRCKCNSLTWLSEWGKTVCVCLGVGVGVHTHSACLLCSALPHALPTILPA